jgi:rSAM/selenodomain-associated transferase 1
MNHLVIMAKKPQAGRVKTRLARQIGTNEAVRIYRGILAETLRRLGKDPRWQTWLAISPDTAAKSSIWPTNLNVVTQGSGDLGVRMQRIFVVAPQGPAIIFGSDIPGISADEIAQGFKMLGRNDAVIGPAMDGGYWLIGLKRFPRIVRPFDNVRWSGPQALEDTMRNLAGLKVGHLAARRDIDTCDDYRDWLAGRMGEF